MVYNKIQTNHVFRIIGLLSNLIYWTIFAFINRVQVDVHTKQQLLYKILEELHYLEKDFKNKGIFEKLFMPIFIIIIRIECEALFQKKFKIFFEDVENLDIAMNLINEMITTIFDPNCYFNTFTLLSMDATKLRHKIKRRLYPNYKTKMNATSNYVNQLFTTFNSQKNVRTFLKGKDLKQEEFKVDLESKITILNFI